MAAKIREHTGSNLGDIKLVRLPSKTKIPDGAEYRVQFPSRRGFTNKCILAGVEHSSNNIKMLVRLHDRSGPPCGLDATRETEKSAEAGRPSTRNT